MHYPNVRESVIDIQKVGNIEVQGMSIGQVNWLLRSQWQNGPHKELEYGSTQTKLDIGCTPTLVFRLVDQSLYKYVHMLYLQHMLHAFLFALARINSHIPLHRRHEGHTPWNEWWQQHLERLPLASFKLATVLYVFSVLPITHILTLASAFINRCGSGSQLARATQPATVGLHHGV